MKIGYPCINRSLGGIKTFRLRNYSKQMLITSINKNLDYLFEVLNFNLTNDLLFFRISSQIVPFASHKVCRFDWQTHFSEEFKKIGKLIKKGKFRISMHPDQFVLINAKDKCIHTRSVDELKYHCDVLDLLKLDNTAKVQLHVGGVYNDKQGSIKRFVSRYAKLPEKVLRRLVIENDDKSYSLRDCIKIHYETSVPVLFDSFHHECLNNSEPMACALSSAFKTWKKKDGAPMVDYSSQKRGARRGSHTEHIDVSKFKSFIQKLDQDVDIMLEIKDKEQSALKAIKIINKKYL